MYINKSSIDDSTYYTYVLPNGLRVYIIQDKDAESYDSQLDKYM